MPRSSRSKSHKQSKHNSKEYSDSGEDVKVKERNGGKEVESVRVSKEGEKRKFTQSRDGKDLSGHGSGDVAAENVVSKRRKEKAEGGGSDKRNLGGDVASETKELKVLVDTRSKSSSRRHESGSDKKEDGGILVVEKEEIKGGGSRVDSSKRRAEKESGRKESREVKGRDRAGTDKVKKVQDAKDGEVARKQGSTVDIGEEQQGKREWPIQEDLRNPELEKELEKRARRRGDGSSGKDKYQDDMRESDDKRSSRGERSKDVRHKDEKHKDERHKDEKHKDERHKDEKHKDERHGDKYQEDGEKDNRHRDDKYREDGNKDRRYRDVKYQEDGEKDIRHRDDKYREDGEKDRRYRDVKHREGGEKDISRHRDDKYRDDSNRDIRHRDDKYRDDVDRVNRHRDDKCRDDGDRDNRRRDEKYREDDRDNNKHKEEKLWEDVDRDSKYRDAKQRNDSDRDKRARDVKYRDEHSSRDITSEFEMKRLRDESNAEDIHYNKSTNGITPICDDRITRYDTGRRRANDKEGHSDARSRGTKEQRFDAEKRSVNSSKVDLVTDRGRTTYRNLDVDIPINHNRRRSSPSSSSHVAIDHNNRVSKPEESKYRDYGYEERVRPNLTSNREFGGAGPAERIPSSRSVEKSIPKDDYELSAERRPRSDARSSPLQIVDKSPSSTSNERRHLNRSDIRRNVDVEESGRRSGNSRDYFGRDGKGSREFPTETYSVDEFSQADVDNMSVSSPFTRNNNFSSNSRSRLPPPFRTGGVDSPSVDDNRGRSNNNRHRRTGDSNMGRPQGNSWKGGPSWPSPVSNGFIPFQHGPPPVGFHPMMQPFPTPIFGVRPTMDLNHTLPYNMPDADRFPGHVRPPPLHGWDANNGVFGDDTRAYGRSDWDQNRTQVSNRGWDVNGDMWKGQNSDLTSVPQKEDLARPQTDDVWDGQPGQQQAQTEQSQPNIQVDKLDVHSSGALDNITSVAPKNTQESSEISKMSEKDDACVYHVYLSKLDISTDLTQPELYDQFTSLMDIDQNTRADEDNSKILYAKDVLEAKVANKISSDSLFPAIDDSVFQKAMSLYTKQREEIVTINREKVASSNLENLELVEAYDSEKITSNDDKPGQEAVGAVSDYKEEVVDMSTGLLEVEASPTTASQKTDVTDILMIAEDQGRTPNVTEMEVDPVPKQEVVDVITADKSPSVPNLEESDEALLLPGNLEDNEKLIETNEAVMPPESIDESGSVNLSRIHDSPESTH